MVQRGGAVFDLEIATIRQRHRGEANKARKMAMYLAKRFCDLTFQETAAHFGVGSYGVIGWAGFAGAITN